MSNLHYRDVCIATQANVPWYWKGMPGVGKTSIITALARELNVPLHIEIGAIADPIDISGVLMVEGTYVIRKALKWVEELVGTEGIIVFDEFPHSPPSIQAGMLRVICEGKVGEIDLGPGVRRGAIGNPTEVAGGYDLNPALANRFCHIPWSSEGYASTWHTGMVKGFKIEIPLLARDWRLRLPHWKSLIASFAGNYRTSLLSALPPAENDELRSGPWPSPRTWESGATLCAAAESFGEDAQLSLLSGCTGDGAAGEFISWYKNLDLPDAESLLLYPESFPKIIPGREHLVYAIMSNVIALISNRGPLRDDLANEKRRNTDWINTWKVLHQAALQAPDLAFGFVQPMIDIRPSHRISPPKECRNLLLKYGRDIEVLPSASGETQ